MTEEENEIGPMLLTADSLEEALVRVALLEHTGCVGCALGNLFRAIRLLTDSSASDLTRQEVVDTFAAGMLSEEQPPKHRH